MAQDTGEAGWALTRLVKMHAGMRDDLALLRRAVAVITEDCQDLADAAAVLTRLSFRRPGWTLRRYCASFCGFVHAHHEVETSMLFPALLQQQQDAGEPEFEQVIARLDADHRALTDDLEEAERALARLPGDEAAKAAAAGALVRLADRLTEHLDYEETSLAPALNRMSRVVPEDAFPAPPPEHFGISRSSVLETDHAGQD
ncbi:hemerythrin domain-containing protein [Actinopolymorpha sp. B11F2]|uniref:hemerythrin domain-containing protein n=1 Tax=Actinopolymorpha sp. B11F2 TaxID=3160862 RepID=UPI0032E401EC